MEKLLTLIISQYHSTCNSYGDYIDGNMQTTVQLQMIQEAGNFHVVQNFCHYWYWCIYVVQDSIFHLGYQCPHYMSAREEFLEPIIYEIRSFFENQNVLATDEVQWNACSEGIVSDDPSLCIQCRIYTYS